MMGTAVSELNMEVTSEAIDADYLVVNTCGFLESARQESSQAIQDLLELKRQNRKQKQRLLVTGCMINLHKEKVMENYPEVDAILSSGAIDTIAKTISSLEDQEKRQQEQDNRFIEQGEPSSTTLTSESSSSSPSLRRKSFLEQGDTPRFLATPPHYAYLKIAEGCKKRCSFCIIPKIKGPLQSKPIDQLVDEFQALLQSQKALREVILIAQDLGDFGKDFEVNNGSNHSHLTALLRSLLNSTENQDLWLRLLYLYPDEITPDLIELMQSDTRIVRYLDLPIQHSHNDLLRKMRRKTSNQHIVDTIQLLREKLPGVVLRTSLMVGFPGETEDHFEHLLQFVRDQELDNVGVFCYSNESQALSSRLPDHVSEEVKQERYHRLMEAQFEIVQRRNAAAVGQQRTIVLEGLNENQQIVGRHYGQCPDIDNQVILDMEAPLGGPSSSVPAIVAGERYQVEITSSDGYDMIGRIVL